MCSAFFTFITIVYASADREWANGQPQASIGEPLAYCAIGSAMTGLLLLRFGLLQGGHIVEKAVIVSSFVATMLFVALKVIGAAMSFQ